MQSGKVGDRFSATDERVGGESIAVLHVDDEPDVAELTATYLERESDRLSVTTETDPRDALERLQAESFECIVADYEMPGMDGLEFLDTVRATYPGIPFILFTGKGSEEIASDAISRGVTDYLQKGAGTEQYELLANRITNAVEQARARTERDRSQARFQALTENASFGVVSIDEESTVRYANDAIEDVLGYDPERLVGESLLTVMPERFRDAHVEAVDEYLCEGTRSLDWSWVELPGLHADGHEVPLGISFSEFNSDDGRLFTALVRDITERKRRKRELERYESVVETAGDIMYTLDAEGHITWVNDAAVEVTGYDKTELVGEHASVVLTDEDVSTGLAGIKTLIEDDSKNKETFETNIVTADGDTIPCEAHVTLLTDEDGAFEGTVGVVRDISERKEREDELETQRQKIRDLHDIAVVLEDCDDLDDVYAVTSIAAGYVLEFDYCTIDIEADGVLSTKATVGLPAGGRSETPVEEGLVGKTFRTGESFLVADAEQLDESVLAEGTRSILSVPIGDHGVLQIHAEAPDAFDDFDRQVAELLATHSAQTLDKLERERTVRTERDRFAALFEMIPEPVVRVTFPDDEDEPVIQNANPAFEDTFGCDTEAVVGEPVNDIVASEDQREAAREIDRLARSGDPVVRQIRREAVDGPRDFLFRSAPVDDDGHEQFGIYVDVSEQMDRERQLERQNERLEEFTSVVSHDLRNPLNVAYARLDLAADACESEDIEKAEEALDRMSQLIDDLLDLAKHGEVVEDPQPVALDDLVTEVWRSVPNESDLELLVDDATVLADRDRLLQVFENLFQNAVDHAGPDATVEVGLLDDRRGFYVADDGSGIAADQRDAVFDRGYTTNAGGTGFGLSIVQEIVGAHGWTIDVTESADGGARFEITNVTFD